MKRYLFVLLAVSLLLGCGAGVSYAYLTGDESKVNRFQAAEVEITVKEEFDPPDKILPGQIIKKAPSVSSTSNVPCYVRLSVRFSDSDGEKMCEPLVISDGWSKKEDGWYYWNSALMPGQTTAPVFQQIKLKGEMKEEITNFDVIVYAEAVCCGQDSADAAWEKMNG